PPCRRFPRRRGRRCAAAAGGSCGRCCSGGSECFFLFCCYGRNVHTQDGRFLTKVERKSPAVTATLQVKCAAVGPPLAEFDRAAGVERRADSDNNNEERHTSVAETRLDDKYALATGYLYLTGTQALTLLPMLQHQRDQARGLNTGG